MRLNFTYFNKRLKIILGIVLLKHKTYYTKQQKIEELECTTHNSFFSLLSSTKSQTISKMLDKFLQHESMSNISPFLFFIFSFTLKLYINKLKNIFY